MAQEPTICSKRPRVTIAAIAVLTLVGYSTSWGQAPTASKTEARDSDKPVAYRRHVQQCIDTLIQHGTDRYGEVESPLLMAVLDINRRQSPEAPELYDSLIRTEDRLHRRGERGTNLWYDQNVLRAMYRLSEVTGEQRYAQAADAYLRFALEVCVKPNGLLVWGTHIYWDCFADRAGGDQDGAGPHEILIHLPAWEAMYRVNPEAIRREVDGIWQWHIIDHETGLHNRHDDQQRGCDFAFSGGSFALAFASMYHLTSEAVYLERARTVANWHWRHRDPITGLVADAPGLAGRYDGRHSFTSVTGPFASQLLRCYELTGDASFRDMAIAYIKAYEKYGWDDDARSYWGMLALDGTPVPQAEQGAGYDRYQPTGHVDLWRTIMFSYEFPLVAAQASVYAYEMTRSNVIDGDPELLAIALHWAEVIQRNLPPRTGSRWKHELEQAIPGVRETGGTYAENYGRAISFFVHLYRATGDAKYLKLAEGIGREAIDKLFDKGLFKGHPAKPYYETVDGVGLLLFALLELDSPQVDLGGAF